MFAIFSPEYKRGVCEGRRLEAKRNAQVACTALVLSDVLETKKFFLANTKRVCISTIPPPWFDKIFLVTSLYGFCKGQTTRTRENHIGVEAIALLQ